MEKISTYLNNLDYTL